MNKKKKKKKGIKQFFFKSYVQKSLHVEKHSLVNPATVLDNICIKKMKKKHIYCFYFKLT